jgi:5'-3' exonuclease
MIALIDGDIVAYRSAFAAERVQYTVWDEQSINEGKEPVFVCSSKAEVNGFFKQYDLNPEDYLVDNEKVYDTVEVAKMAAKSIMEAILNDLEVSEHKVYLTGKGNYRDEVATIKGYKANRDPAAKPKYLPDVRDYLQEFWSAIVIEGMEADDQMGIEQSSYVRVGFVDTTIICSIDKDLKMIPGWHYNFVKREREFVDEITAWRNFYTQCLMGDSTDNIPGWCNITGNKVGQSKLARGLKDLTTPQEMSEYVAKCYEGHEAELEEIAELLWICREPRYG